MRTSSRFPVAAFLLRLASFAGAALASLLAHGNSQDYTPFSARYPAYYSAQPNSGCDSCHAGVPALNVYGTAYRTAVLALSGGRSGSNPLNAIISIESGDADGDGYTNVSELMNGNATNLWKAYVGGTSHPTAAAATSANPTTKPAVAGSTVSYTVTVTNNGNIPDSFTLGVSVFSGQAWAPTITGTATNVPVGGSVTVTVNVAVSGGATVGQSSVARFTAASQANASISATALDLTTTAASATTTALTSSLNPSLGGQSVTFTATVASGGAGTITGSITFLDGASTLCNAVAVASAQAQCTLSTLPPGSHSITAQYSGATTFAPSTSTPVSQVVNAVFKYVNAATGVNTGNCSVQANPCKTITYAMAQATAGNPGDQISVAPGTYNLALGEAFPITFRSGVALVATSSSANNTVIDGAGDTVKFGLFFISSPASGRIEGFTLTNGLTVASTQGSIAQGGALRIYSAGSFTLTRNVFSNNEARGFESPSSNGGLALGGAIYVSFSSGISVTNNVFRGNIARGGNGISHPGTALTGFENGGQGQGGAIYFDSVTGAATNNTIYGNSAIGGNGGVASNGSGNGGSGRAGGAAGNSFTIVNNIFASNSAVSGTGGTPATSTAGAAATASFSSTNNLSFGNTVNGGASTGDALGLAAVTQDPQFFGAPDLQIRNSSPAAGGGYATGAPAVDFLGVARANPPAIGAFEPRAIGTVTSLGSSANPASSGQAVTFTATIAIGAPGALTGTVTFKDGATAICTAVAVVSAQAQCATSSLSSGTRSITAEYSGSANFGASTSAPLSQVVNNPDPARLGNIATRGQVLTGNDVMIAGFVIGGSINKTVVVRARGPSLVPFGITNALANPHLRLVRSSDQANLVINDDWGSAPNAAAIAASGFAPSDPLEAAVLASLPPGAYTAVVSGVGGGTGVGIVEVFEVDHPEVPLINIATRGQVLTGNDVMIGGFVIQGNAPQTVVIRARGPSLIPFGITNALANPHLRLVRSSDQANLVINDDWGSAPNASAIAASGFAPSDPLEAAILVSLPPGAYTAIVSGVGGGTGVGIVEVFAN